MGNLVTLTVTNSQNPCRWASEVSTLPLPMKGIGNRFTLGPINASTAGNSVRVAASATSTTRIAPRARDWKKEKGTIRSPQRATTTVRPLKSTVRPAVAPVLAVASYLSRPRPISSLKRDIMRSE